MQQKNLNKLIENALAIEAREAKEFNALGYMGRALVQATYATYINNLMEMNS